MTEDLTGSVQKKGGVYYAVINYHDPCGKRKQKWVNTHLSIKNNRRNAEKFLERAIEEFERRCADGYDSLQPGEKSDPAEN